MRQRMALLVVCDAVVAVDGILVRPEGLRWRGAVEGRLEHEHEIGQIDPWHKRTPAGLSFVLGLVRLWAPGESRAADAMWPAMLAGELDGVSPSLKSVWKTDDVIVAAEIAEISIVLTPGIPTARVIWAGEVEDGRVDREEIKRRTANYWTWREANVREVVA